eukprot:GGOE01044636.1.p1 GENE.GGOE01044636.1~~GGOE01044636.1.p1  ORF type:complete len:276 (-),score=42.70 GGOE01044636.1:86-913(-)
MLGAVKPLLRPGTRVVEFAAGAGHLGLLLAHLFPDAQVVVVDRKERSLEMAQRRITSLGLSNARTMMLDIMDFTEPFDVGVALHACGLATDVIQMKCLQSHAAYVIAPCCYGKLQHVAAVLPLQFPRSQRAKAAQLHPSQHALVAAAADYSPPALGPQEMAPETSDQEEAPGPGSGTPDTGAAAWDFDCAAFAVAEQCMGIVNRDRNIAAEEAAGFVTYIWRMHPPHCTPRNQIIGGGLRPELAPSLDNVCGGGMEIPQCCVPELENPVGAFQSD